MTMALQTPDIESLSSRHVIRGGFGGSFKDVSTLERYAGVAASFEEKTSNVESSKDKANVEVSVTTNNDENEIAEVPPPPTLCTILKSLLCACRKKANMNFLTVFRKEGATKAAQGMRQHYFGQPPRNFFYDIVYQMNTLQTKAIIPIVILGTFVVCVMISLLTSSVFISS